MRNGNIAIGNRYFKALDEINLQSPTWHAVRERGKRVLKIKMYGPDPTVYLVEHRNVGWYQLVPRYS
jgi:hypothetical protein